MWPAACFWLVWLVSPRRRHFPGVAESEARANKNDELQDRSAATPARGLPKSKKIELLHGLKSQLVELGTADHTGPGRLKTRAKMVAKQVFGKPSGQRIAAIHWASFFVPHHVRPGVRDDRPGSNRVLIEMSALLNTWMEEVEFRELRGRDTR